MKVDYGYSYVTGLWYANLLGGEFANCYGQGPTPEDAVTSLKIRVYQLRSQIKEHLDES